MSPAWVASLTALIAAIFGLVGWVARFTWRLFRRTNHFLDDYFGEAARDGLPARPGIMARLKSVEDGVGHVASELAKVSKETMPNNGKSIHDVLARTEQSVDETRAEQTSMRARVDEIKDEQTSMRARMEQLETQRHHRDDHEDG